MSGKTQSTEYIIAMKDGDTRWFDKLGESRDFIEENHEQIKDGIEKRVWDHTECDENHHWCEIDEDQTEMVSINEFMSARSDWK